MSHLVGIGAGTGVWSDRTARAWKRTPGQANHPNTNTNTVRAWKRTLGRTNHANTNTNTVRAWKQTQMGQTNHLHVTLIRLKVIVLYDTRSISTYNWTIRFKAEILWEPQKSMEPIFHHIQSINDHVPLVSWFCVHHKIRHLVHRKEVLGMVKNLIFHHLACYSNIPSMFWLHTQTIFGC